MHCSTPGLPVHHQLSEFTQTHVHRVGDAIQPSHPLLSPSSRTFDLSQHQGLFKWVISLHQVARVLEFQLQQQSFQWTPRTDLLQDVLVGSSCSPRETLKSLFQHHSSKASVLWCSAFFIVQLSHALLRNTVTRLLLGAWQIRPEGRSWSLLCHLPLSREELMSLPSEAGVGDCENTVWGPPEMGLARRGKPLALAGSPHTSHPSVGSARFQGGLGDGKCPMGVKLPRSSQYKPKWEVQTPACLLLGGLLYWCVFLVKWNIRGPGDSPYTWHLHLFFQNQNYCLVIGS